jgi:hypothetical protein
VASDALRLVSNALPLVEPSPEELSARSPPQWTGPEVVNPETGDRQSQHVVQRCGMRNANTAEPAEQCLPVGSERQR